MIVVVGFPTASRDLISDLPSSLSHSLMRGKAWL